MSDGGDKKIHTFTDSAPPDVTITTSDYLDPTTTDHDNGAEEHDPSGTEYFVEERYVEA